jgi:hypothetical protein
MTMAMAMADGSYSYSYSSCRRWKGLIQGREMLEYSGVRSAVSRNRGLRKEEGGSAVGRPRPTTTWKSNASWTKDADADVYAGAARPRLEAQRESERSRKAIWLPDNERGRMS